jgi:hypothetical protein
MKNTLLVIALFALAGFTKINAQQIVNYGFENWATDTFAIASGVYGTLPADTVSFSEPVGWTSSNFLTGLDSLGHALLVTQSSNAYGGLSAVQLQTDSVHVPPGLITELTALHDSTLIIPGFVISGIFPLGVSTFTSGSQINPGSVAGGGQPFTKRLASFNGYYNYAPVLNTNSGANDTCTMWATLRKGKTIIANAIYKSNVATNGYASFSANFVYVSCDEPDTLVILLASSAPNVYSFIPALGGSSLLQPGSRLLVDSLTYDTLPASYVFAPFARNDSYTIYGNTTDTLNVLSNDTDCASSLSVTITGAPTHGTAIVLSDNSIQYTPAANYLGFDYIYYVDKDASNDTTGATCTIYVTQNTSIQRINQVSVNLHPVPANNELFIQFANPGKCSSKIYDVVGNLLLSTELNNSNNQVNIQSLSSGLYAVEILNEQNTVIGRSKFVVVK